MRNINYKFFSNVLDHIVFYPTPTSINYFWNFGSLSGIFLSIQIITGLFLSMHYAANVLYAFFSLEHIMRDVNNGWLLRYIHSNGASFFFLVMYIHIGRSLYYKAFKKNDTAWVSGILIFFLTMAAAFLGYVLPWGQMSFWGATVITNLFSAIPYVGKTVAYLLWGGFSVGNPTLNRFFSLHYLIPFIIAAVVIFHLLLIHNKGSTSPISDIYADKSNFYPYFYIKDFYGFLILMLIFFYFIIWEPNMLGHPDNYIEANPLVTPPHIVPEWYFLPYYAILRSIPNKLGGVIFMFLSIIVFGFLSTINNIFLFSSNNNNVVNKAFSNKIVANYFDVRFNLLQQTIIIVFFIIFILLGLVGALPAEEPYVTFGLVLSILYFSSLFAYSSASLSIRSYVNNWSIFSNKTNYFFLRKDRNKINNDFFTSWVNNSKINCNTFIIIITASTGCGNEYNYIFNFLDLLNFYYFFLFFSFLVVWVWLFIFFYNLVRAVKNEFFYSGFVRGLEEIEKDFLPLQNNEEKKGVFDEESRSFNDESNINSSSIGPEIAAAGSAGGGDNSGGNDDENNKKTKNNDHNTANGKKKDVERSTESSDSTTIISKTHKTDLEKVNEYLKTISNPNMTEKQYARAVEVIKKQLHINKIQTKNRYYMNEVFLGATLATFALTGIYLACHDGSRSPGFPGWNTVYNAAVDLIVLALFKWRGGEESWAQNSPYRIIVREPREGIYMDPPRDPPGTGDNPWGGSDAG